MTRDIPSPENCPEPYNHEVFRYCPTCSWVQESDEPTDTKAGPHEAAYLSGYAAAVEVVKRQVDLPSLIHFDRPSDFRKGVLSCLAALEAEAAK